MVVWVAEDARGLLLAKTKNLWMRCERSGKRKKEFKISFVQDFQGSLCAEFECSSRACVGFL